MITANQLQQFAKEAKLDLSLFDHVTVYTNEQYTKLYICVFNLVCSGGNRYWHNTQIITKSVRALERRELWPDELETNGERWINEIK